MNNKKNQNGRSQQESREERVLALLLNELNQEEAKTIEDLLAHDADLLAYRNRMEQVLDLVAESARAKVDLESDTFRLDPERRQALEKLWTDNRTDHETEESGKAIPFESATEPVRNSRSQFSRFLLVVAAAVVAVGATGVIVNSLNELTKQEEDMALATQDAIGPKKTENSVMIARPVKALQTDIAEEKASASTGGANLLRDQSTKSEELALAEATEVLNNTVIEKSEKILNARLVADVVAITDEQLVYENNILADSDLADLRGGFDETADRSGTGGIGARLGGLAKSEDIGSSLKGGKADLQDLDDSKSAKPLRISEIQENEAKVDSFAVLNRKLSEEKKTVGTVSSFLEADAMKKRTASASGGASAAGAGLLVARDFVAPISASKPIIEVKSKVAAPFARTESASLGFITNDNIQEAEADVDSLSLPVEQIAVTEDAPSTFALDEFASEITTNAELTSQTLASRKESLRKGNQRKEKVVSSSSEPKPQLSSLPSGKVFSESKERLKKVQEMDREKEDLAGFSSLHDSVSVPGAIAGEKGGEKELLAFADFGLVGTDRKSPVAPILSSSTGVLADSGGGIAESQVSVKVSEGSGGVSPTVSGDPADSSRKSSAADSQAVPESTLASGPDRWMIWTGLVLLGVVALAAFVSRGKA